MESGYFPCHGRTMSLNGHKAGMPSFFGKLRYFLWSSLSHSLKVRHKSSQTDLFGKQVFSKPAACPLSLWPRNTLSWCGSMGGWFIWVHLGGSPKLLFLLLLLYVLKIQISWMWGGASQHLDVTSRSCWQGVDFLTLEGMGVQAMKFVSSS